MVSDLVSGLFGGVGGGLCRPQGCGSCCGPFRVAAPLQAPASSAGCDRANNLLAPAPRRPAGRPSARPPRPPGLPGTGGQQQGWPRARAGVAPGRLCPAAPSLLPSPGCCPTSLRCPRVGSGLPGAGRDVAGDGGAPYGWGGGRSRRPLPLHRPREGPWEPPPGRAPAPICGMGGPGRSPRGGPSSAALSLEGTGLAARGRRAGALQRGGTGCPQLLPGSTTPTRRVPPPVPSRDPGHPQSPRRLLLPALLGLRGRVPPCRPGPTPAAPRGPSAAAALAPARPRRWRPRCPAGAAARRWGCPRSRSRTWHRRCVWIKWPGAARRNKGSRCRRRRVFSFAPV